METLLLLLAFPLAWPFIAKKIWHNDINWTEMVLQIVICVSLVCGVWFAGIKSATQDTEIWNGYITDKKRDHGHYERAYECFCTDVCSGSGSSRSCYRSCQTCYEDRYTVTWYAKSTIGNIRFKHLDRGSKRVYNEPDPVAYKNCIVGEPASLERTYTNYVQAVSDSLFNTEATVNQYANKVPAYPKVFAFYKINRVLNVGSKIQHKTINTTNGLLNEALKDLGRQKQVNIVVILTGIKDPSYKYAVERKWLGGEKNDVIVLVGLDGNKIVWSDTITWALNKNNELFQIKMRDGVEELKTFEPKQFTDFVAGTIKEYYDRPTMEQFEYLKGEIKPPKGIIIAAVLIAILGSLLLTVIFRYWEIDDAIGRKFGRRGRYY